ncbi:hypothetical protein F2P45_30730 [Massilia sp. CCM 8733]|uniref:Uncharacterized protein n=1 Tax=Massilia mucilaginosa TaxID=2609282 RepID=A0ABX0P226_9BURK|nr:hypothetical protein [Massilia mucilaginosa]NHZ93351.1 hypothetical protein [Massilia mucilaginosa]
MSAPRQGCCFAYLQRIGLINGRQYRDAMARPAGRELSASPTLVAPLAWLTQHGLVAAEQLVAAFDTLELASDRNMLGQALEQCELFCMDANGVWFDQLVREDLALADQRAAVLEAVGFEKPLSSPGEVLVRMVDEGLMTRQRFDAVRELTRGSARRMAILEEAVARFAARAPTRRSAAARNARPKPFWFQLSLFLGVPLGVVIGLGLIWREVNALPACDGWTVRARIEDMLPRGAGATLAGIREVGYLRRTGVRGCGATASIGGKAVAFAFTLAKDKEDDLVLVQADPVIVQTRFGRPGANDKAADLVYPMTRAALESAMRDGIKSIMPQGDLRAAEHRQRLARRNYPGRWALSSRELRGEIADLEPVAPCRAVVVLQRYSCRLLIERNDPLRMGNGGGSTLHEGEFSFEHNEYTGAWRTGEYFKWEYAAAIAAPRPAR